MLVGIGGTEVDTAIKPGHQELVVFELANQDAPCRLGISHGAIVAGGSVGHVLKIH